MPINPSIAMGLQVPDMVGSFMQGANFGQQQGQQSALKDLLPQAAHGDQAAIDQLWAVDPNIAMKMDQRQREQAAAMTEDLSSAVRWADTPDKWQYVQQHYGSQGVDLSPYKFEDREKGLVALGKISGYLKAGEQPNQPSDVREYEYAKSQGFNGTFMDYKNQMGSPIMVDNGDGTKTLYPRTMLNGGGQQQGASPPPPPPGFVPDQGGPSQGGSGGFRY